jgi:hypothetical protein
MGRKSRSLLRRSVSVVQRLLPRAVPLIGRTSARSECPARSRFTPWRLLFRREPPVHFGGVPGGAPVLVHSAHKPNAVLEGAHTRSDNIERALILVHALAR